MEDISRYWYCIDDDNRLYVLGDIGDAETARETADDLGLAAVAVFDQQTADEWREILRQTHDERAQRGHLE
jgi:2-hydroxychromene-2-carboxylate isomerase